MAERSTRRLSLNHSPSCEPSSYPSQTCERVILICKNFKTRNKNPFSSLRRGFCLLPLIIKKFLLTNTKNMKTFIKPRILQGTRDFLPKDMAKREYAMNKIKSAFINFGYDSIQTPAIEYAETILGK